MWRHADRHLLVEAFPGILCHEAEQGEESPSEGIKAGVVKIRVVRCFKAQITGRAAAAARTQKVINCTVPCFWGAMLPLPSLQHWDSKIGRLPLCWMTFDCPFSSQLLLPLNVDDNTSTSEFHAEGSGLGRASRLPRRGVTSSLHVRMRGRDSG